MLGTFRVAALLAVLMGVAVVLLALRPAPAPESKALFHGAQLDEPTLALFQRACQNCHSENTVWPWYSRIPPASWMIRKDIDDARRHVNFSHWDAYRPDEQQELLTRIGSVARSGQMPLRRYTVLHSEAVLSPLERQQIYEWSRNERRRVRSR